MIGAAPPASGTEGPGPLGATPGHEAPMGEKLDHFYRSRKEEGELQTTEIPISMLMALDKLVHLSEQNPETLKVSAHHLAEPETERKSQSTVRDLSGHLKRVAAYAKLLSLKYGMSEQEANFVKQIAPMHDIGKWAIPESILQKPSALSPEEWEIMKTHTQMGFEMLKDSKLDVLQMGALVAVQHQEKFDGTGYPKGLKGEEIHIYSRITTVADVFDALGSERSYKQAWATIDIIQYFAEGRGTHFDPMLVDLLLDNLDDFLAIRKDFPIAALGEQG
ncbi:MAG: multi-sensor response regulator c-di-GMP phosphodiesterase, RpfG family [Fibrobacteres bacterium]|nr:multi-sensor response regulator c-di-GMP phosphodiesterase, RpfG family [Fibrobacterota bacterium]